MRRTEKRRIIRAVDQKSKQNGRPAVGLGASVIMSRVLRWVGSLVFGLGCTSRFRWGWRPGARPYEELK